MSFWSDLWNRIFTKKPPPPPPVTPPPVTPPPAAGVVWGGNQGYGILSLNQNDLDHTLALARDAGMTYFRFDIGWATIEARQGQFDWTAPDRVVAAITAHTMTPLGVITYKPGWANLNQFGGFAATAARRYRTRVPVWEVWNEPNLANNGVADGTYPQVLRSAHTAIKEVDPTLIVLTGGLSPAPTANGNVSPADFIDRLYKAGGRDCFDHVAMHPYSNPSLPTGTENWNSFHQMVTQVRPLMVNAGDSAKNIWLTECGAATGSGANMVTPAFQAQTMQSLAAQATRYPWIGPMCVYCIRDTGTDASDREQNFGLVDVNWQPKPAYTAVQQL
jgi:hypothetical protein